MQVSCSPADYRFSEFPPSSIYLIWYWSSSSFADLISTGTYHRYEETFQHFLCKIFYYCKIFFLHLATYRFYLVSTIWILKAAAQCAMKLRANSNIFACNQNILRIFWINCGGIQFSSYVEYWHSETDWIPEATNSPNIFEKIFVFQGIVKFTSQVLEVPQKCFDI